MTVACIIVLRENSKIHDQTITELFFLLLNTETKYLKKRLKLEEKYSYNPSAKYFYLLAQFPFSPSEMELAYYHHKMNVRVAEQDADRLKGSLQVEEI